MCWQKCTLSTFILVSLTTFWFIPPRETNSNQSVVMSQWTPRQLHSNKLFCRCRWTLKYPSLKKKKAGHEFFTVSYYTVWCFPLQCSAGVFSGDVLGELVGGYLHLQMAPLSIIHHVFEYFLCSSFFTLHPNVKSRRKRSPGSFCCPNLWQTELLWHCVFQTSLYFNVLNINITLGHERFKLATPTFTMILVYNCDDGCYK